MFFNVLLLLFIYIYIELPHLAFWQKALKANLSYVPMAWWKPAVNQLTHTQDLICFGSKIHFTTAQ